MAVGVIPRQVPSQAVTLGSFGASQEETHPCCPMGRAHTTFPQQDQKKSAGFMYFQHCPAFKALPTEPSGKPWEPRPQLAVIPGDEPLVMKELMKHCRRVPAGLGHPPGSGGDHLLWLSAKVAHNVQERLLRDPGRSFMSP